MWLSYYPVSYYPGSPVFDSDFWWQSPSHMSDTLHISPNMIDPFVVGVVDEELPQEVVKDEDEGDVQCEVGHVAKAVLYPDPVPMSPEEEI